MLLRRIRYATQMTTWKEESYLACRYGRGLLDVGGAYLRLCQPIHGTIQRRRVSES